MTIDKALTMLRQPVGGLVVARDRVVPPSAVLSAWPLSERDEQALRAFGLPRTPDGVCIPADFTDPKATVSGTDWFELAHFPRIKYDVGIEPDTAVVRTQSTRAHRSAGFVNSTVELFVECCWRWYWFTGYIDEFENDIRYYDLLDLFIDYLTERDPATAEVDGISLWRGMATPV